MTDIRERIAELAIDKTLIHKWDRQRNQGIEFNCDFWDCPNKIKADEYYFVEIYPDGNIHQYCESCAAFFLSQSLNILFDSYTRPAEPLGDRVEAVAKIIWEQCLPDDYGIWEDDRKDHPELSDAIKTGAKRIILKLFPVLELTIAELARLRQHICEEILTYGESKREGPDLALTLDRIFAAFEHAGYTRSKPVPELTFTYTCICNTNNDNHAEHCRVYNKGKQAQLTHDQNTLRGGKE